MINEHHRETDERNAHSELYESWLQLLLWLNRNRCHYRCREESDGAAQSIQLRVAEGAS